MSVQAQQTKNKDIRVFAQAGFGHGNFYPGIGTQLQIRKNSFIQLAVAYGTTGQIHQSNTYHQNADGSYSPENDISWYQQDSSTVPPSLFPGLREQLDLSFQALSFYAQYQLLMVGYIKNKNRYLCFISGGISWTEVHQTGSMKYLDLNGNTIVEIPGMANFHSFSPDIELTFLYEHKSGFGIRAGGRLSFGFPMDQSFKMIYGTSSANLYSGQKMEAYAGFSYRF